MTLLDVMKIQAGDAGLFNILWLSTYSPGESMVVQEFIWFAATAPPAGNETRVSIAIAILMLLNP